MVKLNPKDLTTKENYKLLIGSIVPRPIAFITSLSNDNIVNGAPFSYFNIVSSNPPMVSISIGRRSGNMKDTARNINDRKEFVIHLVNKDNVEEINKTAASLSPNESEIKLTSLTLIESETIAVPSIKETPVRFECRLERQIELGENEEIRTDLIIGKITHYHIDPSIYQDGKINIDQLQAMSRLAGADYATIGDIYTIERPK